METKKFDIAIIGGGPGGMYSHYYCNLKGYKTCLLEATDKLGGQPLMLYGAKTVYDFPGFDNITGKQLAEKYQNQIKDLSDIYLSTQVTNIKSGSNSFTITTNKNTTIQANYIIVAVGNGIFEFNKIDGIQNSNIHYVVSNLNTYSNKEVIIVGGGDSAVDWVIEISKIAKKVIIIHRREEFRANGTKITKLQQIKNVEIVLNKTSKVLDKNTLEVIDNKDQKVNLLKFDYLVVQYGQKILLEQNKYLQIFNLDKTNKIIVDYYGQTNIKNAYAIGNIASFSNKPLLVSIAVTDAIKAIEDITRKIKKYE